MIKSAVRLQAMGADVILVPCNTAHFFLEDVAKCVDVPILDMPRETAKYLHGEGIHTVAVLATDGTLQSGLYDRALREEGILPVYPQELEQKMIMSIIYDYIKAGKPCPYEAQVAALQERLMQLGVECMILGCTELPIAFSQWNTVIPTVDPTEILARSALRFTGSKLKTAQ